MSSEEGDYYEETGGDAEDDENDEEREGDDKDKRINEESDEKLEGGDNEEKNDEEIHKRFLVGVRYKNVQSAPIDDDEIQALLLSSEKQMREIEIIKNNSLYKQKSQ